MIWLKNCWIGAKQQSLTHSTLYGLIKYKYDIQNYCIVLNLRYKTDHKKLWRMHTVVYYSLQWSQFPRFWKTRTKWFDFTTLPHCGVMCFALWHKKKRSCYVRCMNLTWNMPVKWFLTLDVTALSYYKHPTF